MSSELSHTIDKLEFREVLEIISRRAVSERAVEFILNMRPRNSRREADELKGEIMELTGFLNEGGESIPVSGWNDTRPILEGVISDGQGLDGESLLRIAEGELQAEKVRKFLKANGKSLPSVSRYASGMRVRGEVARKITKIIDEDFQVVDSASQRLAELRNKIRRERNAVRKRFSRFAERYEADGGGDFVTVRGGRYVVAVRRGGGRSIKGIVHHQSGSGQSVFIEPLELIEDNNRIESLMEAERKEVNRILREITRSVYHNRESMLLNQDSLLKLDILNAAASFSYDFACSAAENSTAGEMALKNGRHPLLEMELRLNNRAEELVGLNLECSGSLTVVVISGPNAGGKSVALKTIGILILMDQSGLPVPADPGTVLPVCSSVLVDIGDDQSIKKSLSTFSSRVVRIRNILSIADSRSIVLIDEIGDGTSNEEGEVIAEAVLEKLSGISGKIFVTTHFTSLKSWAYERDNAENATLEFDPDSLTPLYRMKMGIPGRSWGIETAGRLGIGDDLVRKAREKLKSGSRDLENLLASLERKREHVEKELAALEAERSRIEILSGDYRDKLSDFEKNRKEMEAEARREALEIVSGAGAEIEKLVSSIKASKGSAESIKKARSAISKRKEDLRKKISRGPDEENYRPVRNPEPGMPVRIRTLGKDGRILSVENQGRIFVELEGGIKVETDIGNLSETGSKIKGNRRKVSWSASISEPVKPEIMVRGMFREDALQEIDRYIDQAVLQGIETVRIIHGIGEGILRKAIYRKLKNDPRIADVRPGEPAIGGDGVAVVRIK